MNFLETLLPGKAAGAISDTVNQGLLKGMELSEELEAEFCKPAYLQKGVKYPTECEVGRASTCVSESEPASPQLAYSICTGIISSMPDTRLQGCASVRNVFNAHHASMLITHQTSSDKFVRLLW